MRFKHFLENVIDSEDKFNKKRSKDFDGKIKNVIDSIPGALKLQADLEKHVSDTVQKLKNDANKKFSKYRLQLAGVLKEYNKDFFIPNIFFFLDDLEFGDESQESLDSMGIGGAKRNEKIVFDLVKEHGDEFLKVLEDYKNALNDLSKWASEQKWPAGKSSFSRDTKFDYEWREMNDCLNGLKKIMKKVSK